MGVTVDKNTLTLATIKAMGFTQLDVHCPRCSVIRVRPWPDVPEATTWGALKRRLRCAKCGGRPSDGGVWPSRAWTTADRDADDRKHGW